MLPSRFRALNSESSDESESKETPNVTKEALVRLDNNHINIFLKFQNQRISDDLMVKKNMLHKSTKQRDW